MADDQNYGADGIGSASSDDRNNLAKKIDLGAKTGEAVTKLAQAVQQAGSQAKETATSLASEAAEKTKGLLHHQVEAGADFVGDIAQSVRVAADSLNQNAPQLADLVRGVAQQVDEFSKTVRGQTVEEFFETTSDFVRRNPALVLSAAAACGFMLFRVIRASPSDGRRPEPYRENLSTAGRMQPATGSDSFQSQRGDGQGQASPFNGA